MNKDTYCPIFHEVKTIRLWNLVSQKNITKYFSSKIMHEMRQGDSFQISFWFLHKLYMRWRQVLCSLAINISIALNLAYNRTNCKKLRLLIQRYSQIWFFRKGSGKSFSAIFCIWFFKKTSVNWPNFVGWLSLLVEILGNM